LATLPSLADPLAYYVQTHADAHGIQGSDKDAR